MNKNLYNNVESYEKWARELKVGDEVVVEDNSFCYDLDGNRVLLAQPDYDDPDHADYPGPTNNELGARYLITAVLPDEVYGTFMRRSYPTVKVKSTKTNSEYKIGICWGKIKSVGYDYETQGFPKF